MEKQLSFYSSSDHQSQQPHTQPNQNLNSSMLYSQTISYAYPTKLFQFKNISGRDEFRKLLEFQSPEEPQKTKGWMINITEGARGSYMYINCCYCKSRINYKYNDESHSWELAKYNNNHIHQVSKNKIRRTLTQIAVLKNLNLNDNDLYKKISTSYPVQKQQVLKIKKDLLKYSNFNIIKQLLSDLQYDIRYEMSKEDMLKEGFPQILIAVSAQQKNNYQKYGEILSYDINYNCIKEKAFNGKKYGVGIFTGFDNNNRILVFGFSLITTETTQNFKKIFRWFFQLVCMINTSTIITGIQKNVICSLEDIRQQMNYEYNLVFDSWHFMKLFEFSLRGKQKDTKQFILDNLSKLVSQSDPLIGQQKLKTLKKILQKQKLQKEYKKILDNTTNACYWALPKFFIGLTMHSEQRLNQLIRIKIQNQINFYKFIEKFEHISKQKIQKSLTTQAYQTYPFEDLFGDIKIQQVRFKIQKVLFNAFINHYKRAGYFKLLNHHDDPQYLQDQVYQLQDIIIVDNIYQIKNWQCTCQVLQKKGIPCSHIIHLAKSKCSNQGYLRFFNKRWIPHQKFPIKQALSKGRSKRSRQNRAK